MTDARSTPIPPSRSARFFSWQARQPHLSLPFSEAEYAARLASTRQLMQAQGYQALVICGDPGHPGDVRWLANWAPGVGNAFLFVPARGEAVLVLHDEVMSYELCATWVKEILPPARGPQSLLQVRDAMVGLLRDHGVSARLGVAGETGLPTPVYQGLLAAMPQLEVADATYLLAAPRAIKSPAEIAVLREAVRQSDLAMQAALATIRPGASEREVAAEALRAMVMAGAERPAFQTLVVAGPRAAWKHATPGERPIGRGEPVYIDLGACHLGYCGDLSRTVLIGQPTADQQRALEFALAATAAVKDAARPGLPAGGLAEVGNDVAARFGLTGLAWGTGHGLGCKLREEPLLDASNQLPLQPGMVIAIEPMCVSALGTFVVEDDILITESGSEYLSQSPRRNWE